MNSRRDKLLQHISEQRVQTGRFTVERSAADKSFAIFQERVGELQQEFAEFAREAGFSTQKGDLEPKETVEVIFAHGRGHEVLCAFVNNEAAQNPHWTQALELWELIHQHEGPRTLEYLAPYLDSFGMADKSYERVRLSPVLKCVQGAVSAKKGNKDVFLIALNSIYSWLGDVMLESLKESRTWLLFLEHLRAERHHRNGHASTEPQIHFEREPEMLSDGLCFVSTDVLHEFEQKVRVDIAYPLIIRRHNDASKYMRTLQGELAVLVQFVYSEACIPCQTVIRMFIARRLAHCKIKPAFFWRCFHAAATSIQTLVRGHFGRLYFQECWEARRWRNAIKIQAVWRGHQARKAAAPLFEEEKRRKISNAAKKLQAAFRGFLARRRAKKMKEELKKKKAETKKKWAVITMQRIARGYLGRKIAKHRMIELSLHGHLSKLADKFMINGDMWGFLKAIDEDYRRLQDELDETRKREDEYAETFVKKVLLARDQEHEEAWDKFHGHYAKKFGDSKNPSLMGNTSLSNFMTPSTVSLATGFDNLSLGLPHQPPHGLGQKHLHTLSPEPSVGTVETKVTELSTMPGVRLRQAVRNARKFNVDTMSTESSLARPTSLLSKPLAVSPLSREGGRAKPNQTKWRRRRIHPNLPKKRLGQQASADESLADMEDSLGRKVPSLSEQLSQAHNKIIDGAGPAGSVKFASKSASILEKQKSGKPFRKKKGTRRKPFRHKLPDDVFEEDDQPLADKDSPQEKNAMVSFSQEATLITPEGSLVESQLTFPSVPFSPDGSLCSEELVSYRPGVGTADTDMSERPTTSGWGSRLGTAHSDLGIVTGEWEEGWENSRRRRKILTRASSRFAGTSVLRDIPNGIDDNVDRLMSAAMLRFYVPSSMPPGTTSEAAYEMYQVLPPSLAKVRHEQEATKAATPYAQKLRDKGFSTIRTMMPPSMLQNVMQELDFPTALASIVVQLCHELREAGPAFTRDTLRAKKEMGNLLNWSGRYSPLKTELRDRYSRMGQRPKRTEPPILPSPEETVKEDPTPPESPKHVEEAPSEDILSIHSTAMSNEVVKQLLQDIGAWGTLDGPIEGFLSKAAFFVVEHKDSEPGNDSFKKFIEELNAVLDVDDGIQKARNLVQQRSQAALLLSAPYAVRMKIEGLANIRDLGNTSISTWSMPVYLAEMVEKMLAQMVAHHCSISLDPTKQKGRKKRQGKRARRTNNYDPRFQRSALDPRGRPPRIGLLKPLVKPGDKERKKEQLDVSQNGEVSSPQVETPVADQQDGTLSSLVSSDLPGSLFDHQDQSTKLKAAVRKKKKSKKNKAWDNQFQKLPEKQDGFYICSVKGCNQQFSRAHTLKLHEKTHDNFAQYHRWAQGAQLFRDMPSVTTEI